MVDNNQIANNDYQNEMSILVMRQTEFYDAQLGAANEAARGDSETIFVKSFNNFIKILLINQFSFKCKRKGNLSVLDLCCGRGGDLKKWKEAGIVHYVGMDYSPPLVQEAKKRYDEIFKFNFNRNGQRQVIPKSIFMVNDAGPLDKYQKINESNLIATIFKNESKLSDISEEIRFDIVSTQMAIHYMFESENKLRAYLRNVTDRLEPGSFFIGTTVDSLELFRKVRHKLNTNNTFENDFVKIILPTDSYEKTNSPFGQKYYFYLKEAIGKDTHQDQRPKLVDEYLLQFDVLVQIAKDYGLQLIMKKNFIQYYDDMCAVNPISEQIKFGNNQQQNFSSDIPPPDSREYNRKQFNFLVEKKIQNSNLTQEDVDQQFEISGLYCVFAFKKEGDRNVQRRKNDFGNMKLHREILNCLVLE